MMGFVFSLKGGAMIMTIEFEDGFVCMVDAARASRGITMAKEERVLAGRFLYARVKRVLTGADKDAPIKERGKE